VLSVDPKVIRQLLAYRWVQFAELISDRSLAKGGPD
jgi:hypothetical protein